MKKDIFTAQTKLLLATLLLCLPCNSHTIFIRFEVWHNGRQNVCIVGDIHNDSIYQENTPKHAADVLNFIQSFGSVMVLVEDAASMITKYPYCSMPVLTSGSPYYLTNVSPLDGLFMKCQALLIPSVNVECRQIEHERNNRVNAVKQWLQNNPKSPLAPYYKKILAGDISTDKNKNNKNDLVDVSVVHHIHTHQSIKDFMVAVGERHIDNITHRLSSLGYKKIHVTECANNKVESLLNEPVMTPIGISQDQKTLLECLILDQRLKRCMIDFEAIDASLLTKIIAEKKKTQVKIKRAACLTTGVAFLGTLAYAAKNFYRHRTI